MPHRPVTVARHARREAAQQFAVERAAAAHQQPARLADPLIGSRNGAAVNSHNVPCTSARTGRLHAPAACSQAVEQFAPRALGRRQREVRFLKQWSQQLGSTRPLAASSPFRSNACRDGRPAPTPSGNCPVRCRSRRDHRHAAASHCRCRRCSPPRALPSRARGGRVEGRHQWRALATRRHVATAEIRTRRCRCARRCGRHPRSAA